MGDAYATSRLTPTTVGGRRDVAKRRIRDSWTKSRAERAARTTVAERAAHWTKGEVRANARILPASEASDFVQRLRV
mgnify:FL=1